MAMTETLQDPEPPPPPPPSPPPPQRRLVRDPDDQVVAGVCAALGRFTDTDPVLWRVLLAALALFGGAGLALYGLAWLLIPRTGQQASFVERQLRHPDRSVSTGGVVLLALIALVLLVMLDNGSGVAVLLVVGGVAYLVARERRTAAPDAPAPPAAPWSPAWTAAGEPSSYGVPPVSPAPYDGPAPYETPWKSDASPITTEPRTPRQRSVLGPLTLSAAALVAGALLLLRQLGATGVTGPRVLAAAMLVVGAGLLVGTWYGRARWLLAVGVGLGLALGLTVLTTTALDGRLSGGVGERTWVPTASDGTTSYRLGAGDAVLDLRELEPGTVDTVRAELGLGSLVVLVPDDLRVRVRVDVGVGEVTTSEDDPLSLFDQRRERDDREVLELGPTTGPELELELVVGAGEIEVRRVQG